jgi:hypothetical protein
MHAKRVHANQKDKDLGRWKVIEKELKDRGLPLPFGARGIAVGEEKVRSKRGTGEAGL